MHNRIGFNRLDRKPSHRRALHRNMVTSLIKYERIKTTQAKAKEIRRTAEKLVTRAKEDSVHNRRIAAKTVFEKSTLNKLFTKVGPRFADRPGGYTRILKLGRRPGDAAEMVILEFIKDDDQAAPKTRLRGRRKASPDAAKQKEEAAVEKSSVDASADAEADASETQETDAEKTDGGDDSAEDS